MKKVLSFDFEIEYESTNPNKCEIPGHDFDEIVYEYAWVQLRDATNKIAGMLAIERCNIELRELTLTANDGE